MKAAHVAGLCALSTALASAPAAHGEGPDETMQSAVYLLRTSMTFHKDRRHLRMQRALRQLADPDLVPLFDELAVSDSASLRVYGVLGLAECDPKRQIDLVRLTELDQPQSQLAVISEAMDLDLLSVDQARKLMDWPGLDAAVRIVVATFLLRNQVPPDPTFLGEQLESDNLHRSGLAALVLLETGQTSAIERLGQLNRSESPERDRVRLSLLRIAFESEFASVAPWALDISKDLDIDPALRRMALVVALRFGAAGAPEAWRRHYLEESDPIQKTRYALAALNAAQWVDPSLFDPLISCDERTLQRIGRAGAAVASRQGVVEAAHQAIDLNNAHVNEWALDYVRELAIDDDAQAILHDLILAYDGVPQRRSQRLRHAMAATTLMADRYPQAAERWLRPILGDPETDVNFLRGILLGLIQCRQTDPHPIIAGLTSFTDPQAASLRLLITSRNEHELSASQLRDLALLVRGGGGLVRQLRVLAAWAYLKHTGQTRLALAEVLGP